MAQPYTPVEKIASLIGQFIGIVLTGITGILLFVLLAALVGCSNTPKQYRVATPAANYCVHATGISRGSDGCVTFGGNAAMFCGTVSVVEVPVNMECPTYFVHLPPPAEKP
jgi:hypothetical protein